MRRIDIRDKKFGRLTALSSKRGPDKRMRWRCRCDCGATIENVRTASLINGNTKSCGCSRATFRRPVKGANYRHGAYHIQGFSSYRCMIRRCYNPNDIGYKDYGKRGIRVCRRWLIDPNNFLLDMGPKPTPAHTIDRKNNNKNYTSKNCKWSTRAEQNRNQRRHQRKKSDH